MLFPRLARLLRITSDLNTRRPQQPLANAITARVFGKHLALIGFMGAGKSTIGREVAERVARPFVDTDAEIERLHGPIPELFGRGEPEFRRIEEQVVAEALAVVAEACVAFEIARAAREKFGGDSVGDFAAAWRAYVERIPWTRR